MDYVLCGALMIDGLRGRFSWSCQACWCHTGTVRALGMGEDEENEINLLKMWNNRDMYAHGQNMATVMWQVSL